MDDKKYPRIGIGVLIKNEQGQALFGLRKGVHDEEWCFPGGHLDFGETIFETARREVKEETGLDTDEFKLISVSDGIPYIKTDNKHYVTIGVVAVYNGDEPKLMEPEKCKQWKWLSLDNLPENMFEPTEAIIENYKAGKVYIGN